MPLHYPSLSLPWLEGFLSRLHQEEMARHHYLGALAKIGETVWYVAIWREQWVAQLSLSAAALKCGVRDRVRDHIG